jgi:hypothetical protein
MNFILRKGVRIRNRGKNIKKKKKKNICRYATLRLAINAATW